MELRTLRYFVGVVEAGSLSRAAATLFVAQPALTAQIKKLEAELDTVLFERSHAGVTPTAAGLQLYRDATRLLADASALRDRLRRTPDEIEGSVTVAVPFLLASLLMGPVLARLRRTHPRVRVFVLDDLSLLVRKAMIERRADVGLLVDAADEGGLDARPFATEAMYVCGHDPDGRVAARTLAPSRRRAGGAAQRRIPLAVAAGLPLVLQSRRFSIRAAVEAAAVKAGVALNVAHEQDSTRVLRSLYLAGAGFAISPACAVADGPIGRADWLVARIVRPELVRSYTLVVPARRRVEPSTQAVIDALVDEAAGLVANGVWDAELPRGPDHRSK